MSKNSCLGKNWYNIYLCTSIGMTLFKVVFGRDPRSLVKYDPCEGKLSLESKLNQTLNKKHGFSCFYVCFMNKLR